MWGEGSAARYGDFDAAGEDGVADAVAGGSIGERCGAGNEAEGARRQVRDADLSFAGPPGQWLRQTLARPAVGRRDRSALQWRMRRAFMRYRS
jgi:hypothetical protein